MLPFPNRHTRDNIRINTTLSNNYNSSNLPSLNHTNQGDPVPTQLAAAQRCPSTLPVPTRTLAGASSPATLAVVLALMLYVTTIIPCRYTSSLILQFQQAQEPLQSATSPRFSEQPHTEKPLGPPQQTNTVGGPAYLWDTRDPDLDDALHNPDPRQNAVQDSEWTIWSARGWANYITLFAILFGLIILFAGYPIIAHYRTIQLEQGSSFNIGGINLTGQVPDLKLPFRIDKDTPEDVYTRTGFDGNKYNLVFSDEFNVDGRTFYPGDDPFWEAVDFNYWPTADIEWYDPGQATTKDGHLVIDMVMVCNAFLYSLKR